MRPLRIGIVGFGAFGRRYAESLDGLGGVDISWVVDPSSEAREWACRRFPNVSVSADMDGLCADDTVTVIVVATPEANHAQSAIAGLRAGKHVLVEKPLATSEDDAKAMLEAEVGSSGTLFPAMLLRFDLRYARLKQRLPSIGTVRSIHAWRNFDRGLFAQYSRTHSFVENAIHDIDLIQWLVPGRVDRVHGFHRYTSGRENPDVNWGVLEIAGGVLGMVQTSWLYPEQPHADLQWNAGIQVMGDRGVLEVRHDAMGLVVHTDDNGLCLVDQSAWDDIAGDPRGAFGAMLRHLVAVWRGERQYQGTTALEAVDAMRIANRLVADANSREVGRWER